MFWLLRWPCRLVTDIFGHACSLPGGEILVLQEATLAALTRAWVDIKADPLRTSRRLVGRCLTEGEGKSGYARWQLLPEE